MTAAVNIDKCGLCGVTLKCGSEEVIDTKICGSE